MAGYFIQEATVHCAGSTLQMLKARWLKKVGSRYELTPEALQQLR